MSADIRVAVKRTANYGWCQLGCGRIAESYAHRLPAGAGGAVTYANGLALCGSGTTGCHGASEKARELSYATGWLVRRCQDPAAVPVLAVVQGITSWWLLGLDGHAVHVDPPPGMWEGTLDEAVAALRGTVASPW